MMKQLLATLICMFFLTCSYSQTWEYNITYFQDAGNPGGLNSESDAPGQTIWTTIQAGSQATNNWTATQPIPFAFDFYGMPVDSFIASQNGLVTFTTNTALLPNANQILPDASLPDMSIAVFWDEFTLSPPTGGNDEIRTAVFGVAPNRQFWIKRYSYEYGNPGTSFSYIAVVLEETTNNIYIVDQYSNSGGAITGTVGVQFDATTADGFGSNTLDLSGNGSNNTDNDYYQFVPDLLVDDNAGISAILNPTIPGVAGLQNVDVELSNFGINTLSSVNLEWEVDGSSQTPVNWTGSLAPNATSSETLGSYNFPAGVTSIKAWTSMPNGTIDNNFANDTLNFTFCTSLNGTYSVGGASPDFTTIDEAATIISNCGVSGPVTINVSPGVYNESVKFSTIAGASATNTVTFDGGNSASILHDASGQHAVVLLEGADYVTFKNFTIENTATTNSWGFRLTDTSDYNVIENCIINLPIGSGNIVGILASASPTSMSAEGNNCNYCTFSNNTINGGESAIRLEGLSSFNDFISGINIINNTCTNNDDRAIYLDNADSITIQNNTITDIVNGVGDGIYLTDIMNFDISYNYVEAKDWAFYIADGNFDGPPVGTSTIINNMFYSPSDYGMYLDDINDINIYHNTSYGNPGIRINDFTNLDIQNNIFVSNNDFAFESDEASNTITVNYNLYWTPPTNALFVDDGPASYSDLALWTAAEPSLNSNSVENSPVFNLPDLHIIGLAANDLGNNAVGVTDDIDGDARPQAPSTIVDMGADEYTPISNDALFIAFSSPTNSQCGDVVTPIEVIIKNEGINPITSMPIVVNITGDITQTISYTYNGNLQFNEFDTVIVDNISTYSGGVLSLEGFVSLAGDANLSNDTITSSGILIYPFEPEGVNTSSCGDTSVVISASTQYLAAYEWYDASVGGNLVGTGNTYTIPDVNTQNTYYLGYTDDVDTLTTTYAAGNGCGGGVMFDIEVAAGTSISGFAVNNNSPAGATFPLNVYYIPGGDFLASATTATDWTLQGSYTVTAAGVGLPSSFNLTSPIIIPSGSNYAIYLEYDARYTNGANTYTSIDGNVTITTGLGLCSSFGGTNNPRSFNGAIYIDTSPCSAIRTPVTATITPAATVNLGMDSLVCGPNITLDAGTPGSSYNWSTGETTQSITTDSTSNYFVELTDSNGCTASDTINITIDPVSLDLGVDAHLCPGDNITLDAGTNGVAPILYVWNTLETSQTINVNSPGTYSVNFTDSLGCNLQDSIVISALSTPTAGFTFVLNVQGITLTSTAIDADSIVYDYGDGTITTDATHTFTGDGQYNVCQTVYNACGTDMTCQTVSIVTSITNFEDIESLTIFPNPTKGSFTLSFESTEFRNATINISSVTGQNVWTKAIDKVSENHSEEINLDLSSGVYLIELILDDQRAVRKLIVE